MTEWDRLNAEATGYLISPALFKRADEHPPAWACQCRRPDGRRLLRKYRHASEIDCVPRAQVEAFKARHGITSEGHAKALMYIESFHPREEGER